jgi:hypothetical protein
MERGTRRVLGADTNVAKLDSGKKIITQAFIKANATGGIAATRPLPRRSRE